MSTNSQEIMHQTASRASSAMASGFQSLDITTSDSGPSELDDHSLAFTNQAARIPPWNKQKFASPAQLASQILEKIGQCVKSGTGCYVYISGVDDTMIDTIDSAFVNRGIRSQVRFTYEHSLEAMIIRCMPGVPHETPSRSFMVKLAIKIASIPGHSEYSIRPVGSARFAVPGKRSKEADETIKPATRSDEDDWPSLVVEVGYSQRIESLQDDALWWLDHSKGQINIVIIIQIKKGPKSMRIECWERLPDPLRMSTRSRPKTLPGFEKYFDIDASGTVVSNPSHPDLIIPYKAIFDSSHLTATDIVISKAELKEWALYIFTGLH